MIEHLVVLGAAAKAAPLVNWSGLFKVLALVIGTAVVIVGGFSLGLAALDVYVWSLRRHQGAGGVTAAGGGEAVAEAPPAVRYASLAVALFLFAVCIAGVAVGMVEMLSK